MLTLLQDDIIQETLRLTDKNSTLYTRIKDYSTYSDKRSSLRLQQWYQFLNEHYVHQPCIHNQLLEAIINDFCRKQSLLSEQTAEELEISFSLLEKIFHSPQFIDLSNKEVTRYLLSILAIYGRYPGMVVGSTYKAVKQLSGITDMFQVRMMFETLFVPFDNPRAITDLLHLLTAGEIEKLMYILQGTSKQNNALPIKLTQKEYNYLMRELKPIVKYEDNILLRHCIYAKLKCAFSDDFAFSLFIQDSRLLRFNAPLFANQIDFWVKVFKLINEPNAVDEFYRPVYILENLLDYLEFMVCNHDDYSLKGRTVHSLSNQMREWHREVDMAYANKKSKHQWTMKGENCRIIGHEGFTYVFLKITSGKRLVYESQLMKHCVYTYVDACIKGQSAIWSVIRKTRTRYQPRITFEINKAGQLVQAFGQYNTPLVPTEERLLLKWCKLENFYIDHRLFEEDIDNSYVAEVEQYYVNQQLKALDKMMPA